MTAPTSTQDNIEQRRERVAQLKLRGLSSREICRALAQGDHPIISPRTGKPFDHMVILSDIEALKLEWKASRGEAFDTHIDRQFTEINEIKKAAWAAKDPELALKALDREMKLLGTAKEKTGDTYNVYFTMVEQIVMLANMRGDDPEVIFAGVVKRLQRANSR